MLTAKDWANLMIVSIVILIALVVGKCGSPKNDYPVPDDVSLVPDSTTVIKYELIDTKLYRTYGWINDTIQVYGIAVDGTYIDDYSLAKYFMEEFEQTNQ